MPTSVVVLRNRSKVRASSPKFVGPVWGRLVALGFSGWPALSDFDSEIRAVRKLGREHGLGRESRGRANWSLALRFSASPAPSDLATKTRAITGLRREPSPCMEWVCLVTQLLALRAGVLRRAQCFTSRFPAVLRAQERSAPTFTYWSCGCVWSRMLGFRQASLQ